MNSPITIQDPDLRSLLLQHRQEIFYNLNCHQVGQIVSFDAATQTASVQIMMKRTVFNQEQLIDQKLQLTPQVIDYPVLVQCPVMFLTGGTSFLTFPVSAGDSCLVLFNDRDIDAWYSTGSNVQPNSQRGHNLSDGFAIVGVRNLANKVSSYSTTDVELRYGTAKVAVKQNGNLDLLSANGGKVQVEEKVGISNSATDLKTVFDNLISALTSWVDTHGDTPNPATIAALNAVKTLADSLLK